jgi:AraC-like DNA-binding protein/quercetin dioxygenase-like cupin family protein
MPPSSVHKESPTLSVLDWRDKRADERLWLLTKATPKPSVLIVRHAGNSIWRKGASIARKHSDLFGIELVTAGNLHFIQDGKEYSVEPGNVFIKRRGGNHQYEPGSAGFVHKRFIRLDGPIIEALTGELGIDKLDTCKLSHPLDFAVLQKRAISLIKNQPPGYATQLSVLAFEILLFVAQDISGNQYPPMLSAAIDHMRHNVHRTITVSELSRITGVSDTQFFRLFREHLKGTPLTYFTTMKIKRAAELLRHTLMSVKEIAFTLGYEEPAYFTNKFRKVMGVSPREYRKRI